LATPLERSRNYAVTF